MRCIIAAVIVLFASSAWGEEVLYCTASSVGKGSTFIVTVISERQRTIANTTGDTRTLNYKCRRPLAMLSSSDKEEDRSAARRILCGSESGKASWVFHNGTFARANLAGPHAITHGTCVKY